MAAYAFVPAAGDPLPCPLKAAATRQPEAPAIVTPAQTLSYRVLDRRVSTAAQRLQALGCTPGTRVALYLPSSADYLVLLWALLRLDSIACPLSTHTPLARVGDLLQRLDARFLITKAPLSLPDVHVVRPDSIGDMEAPRTPHDDPTFAADQPATLLFTSGSTGTPKIALHSFGNHYYSAAGSNQNIILVPGDRWLLSLPLYHVGGLAILFRCVLAGAAVVLPSPGTSPGPAMARYHVSHVSMVPTQLLRLLRDETTLPLHTLKALLLGGGTLLPTLVDEAHARGLPLHTTYGLTEMSSQVATTPPQASPAQLRTAGRVLPFRQLRIAPDGEILTRGSTLFLGYRGGDAFTRPVDADGWFHTGDRGRIDDDGLLHVTGRLDHLFISGGENIQPEEIEQALCRIDGVVQAVVVPVPDNEYGARPVAFVRVAPGALSLTQLPERLANLLPRFKIPDAFYEWDETAESGMKVDRDSLRTRALEMQRMK